MISERASAAPLITELLDPERKEDLDRYLWGMEVIDFLLEHPSIKISAQEFVDVLAKLQPRLYSIASSLKAHPNQVHFIVDVNRYESHGRSRKGVWLLILLADRANNVSVPVYPGNASKQFRLPRRSERADHHGGTGHRKSHLVPAYLQERAALGAKGKNWLFFGSQRSACEQLALQGRVRRDAKGRDSHPLRLRVVA